MQVKLLRVIQEKAVRPVGEQPRCGIDVRILSATHKNLSQLVAEGKFREDLVLSRERDRIARALAARTAGRCAGTRRSRSAPSRPAHEDHAALARARTLWRRSRAYAFPGNVRELENILERAITLSRAARYAAATFSCGRAGRRP